MSTWVKIDGKLINLDKVIAISQTDDDGVYVYISAVDGTCGTYHTFYLEGEQGKKFVKVFEEHLKQKGVNILEV